MNRLEDFAQGLNILAKYSQSNIQAEHDILYAGPDADLVQGEDREMLLRCGWFVDEETNSWAKFT